MAFKKGKKILKNYKFKKKKKKMRRKEKKERRKGEVGRDNMRGNIIMLDILGSMIKCQEVYIFLWLVNISSEVSRKLNHCV